ncbi:MAG: recombinase family protein, partial [Chloroflexi bacterium]|nr:recombinase family protein [Chloroflexota bacterium]
PLLSRPRTPREGPHPPQAVDLGGGEYLDDGVSGTLALDKRPEGLRLMEDAKAGKFHVVAFLKTDRLARNLRYLLDAVDFFDAVGVTLRCLQEPFDTHTPVGRMIVQMMGSFAEMERATILARTSMGRERIARDGRWTGGVIPYGYRIDNEGHLVIANTPRDGYQFSEAEIVSRIFAWVSEGQETARGVANKLNAEGIPAWKKSQRRGMPEPDYRSSQSGLWWPTQIAKMIRSTTYKGEHTFNEVVTREVPAIVDAATWVKANQYLTANTRLPNRADKFRYLLRGLITCATCGALYNGHQQGNTRKAGDRAILLYYRCGAQMGDRQSQSRCSGKMLAADWMENLVWEDIKKFVANPGQVLEELQARMTEELASTPSAEERRQELERILAQKGLEHDRVLEAYRRGFLGLEELAEQITRSKSETEPLHDELMALVASEIDTGITVGDLANTDSLLRTLRDTIEGDLPFETRRAVIEGLVSGITVETQGTGHSKTASVTVSYNFSEPRYAVDNATPRTSIRRRPR